MFNEELLKIRKLHEESKENLKEAKIIRSLLIYHKDSFKYEESIVALEKIKVYLKELRDKFDNLNLNIQEIRSDIGTKCNHSIYINEYPYYCAICGNNVEENDTTEFIIDKFDKGKHGEKIEDIVLDSKDENEAKERLLNFFNNLQFTDKVKISRKTL